MENKEISEAEMICRTIFYSQATNGKAEQSIANGTDLIEQYNIRNTHHNHASFVALVEGEIAENEKYIKAMNEQGTSKDQGALYKKRYNSDLKNLLNKIK